MKTIQTLRLLSLAGLGTLLAATSFAQDSYPYGGLSVGQSRARIDEERISARLLAEGASQTSMTRDERDTAYKVFAGYQFNRNVAVEAGYFNLGQFGFRSTTVPAGTLDGQIKLQGVNLDLVGTLPLSERWSAIARVGAQYAQARDSFTRTGAVRGANTTPSKNAANYKIGLGLQYEVNPSFLVRAEAERYRINDAVGNRGDINLFLVSLVIPFGRTVAAAPRAVAAPVYVAPAPVYVAPAPVIVEVPVQTPPPVYVAPARPLKQDRN
ncbi:MAG: outer membrane beta-barrel protein [Burkholderiaceae bacterium]|nr:outer membrane beta-barrel protein [Burkholderiaceae bacterium]